MKLWVSKVGSFSQQKYGDFVQPAKQMGRVQRLTIIPAPSAAQL